ncbi:MAG: protein phosphatase 2C domain-containing protein, partial [Chloroflexi bacterium]|nr:protein phosphatase 2C domain-containing protein [Chloroflexota bacterium]
RSRTRPGTATKRLSQHNGWYSDKGLQRDTNEDCLSITEILQTSQEKDYCIGIYILADGVSGMAQGELASRIAVRVARQVILQQFETNEKPADACQVWLQIAVHMAHSMVRIANTASPHGQLGTTVVIAIVADNWVHVSNVGDSRAYLISDQTMRQISHDHTFASALVEVGLLSKEEAALSSHRHTLSQALGIEANIYPTMVSQPVCAGDYLLLCSDGLYSQVSEEKVYEIINAAPSPQIACRQLTEAANDAGGEDNISVILVQMYDC